MYDASFKIVVFGDHTDKKKHLMERFVHDIFRSDSKMVIGVEFKVKNVIVNNQKIALEVWGFGGEIRFRFLLPTYVRGARGGLFIFDITNYSSIAHIDDWLTIIKKEITEVDLFPIICVGLQSGDKDNREVSSEEGIKIAKSRGLDGYIECDVETGENVDNAFKALTRLMLKSEM
ncbi:MAG: Rab family GTPase [Candidatus Thorarchaeota archaeon]